MYTWSKYTSENMMFQDIILLKIILDFWEPMTLEKIELSTYFAISVIPSVKEEIWFLKLSVYSAMWLNN